MDNLSKFTEDLNIIYKLANQPTQNADELKKKFDEAGNKIKDYINEVLTAEIERIFIKRNSDATLNNLQIDTSQHIIHDLEVEGFSNLKSGITTEKGLNVYGKDNTGIDLYGAQPFFDTHFNSKATDYTTRRIEDREGHITEIAPNGKTYSFAPNKINFVDDGQYSGFDYWVIRNAHNGHAITMTWDDSRGACALSIDGQNMGYITLTR